MPSPHIRAIVLAHNNLADTRGALASLGAMAYDGLGLILVDNGSADGMADAIRTEFPDVAVIALAENRGFAAGMNVGIRAALDDGADCVLVANNDVLVAPNLLTELVRACGDDVAIAAPLVLSMKEPKRIWSSGFRRHPALLEMRGGLRGRPIDEAPSGPVEVDYVTGCLMLIRSDLLRAVGLFDERFFFYYEDLDLCLRAQRHGQRILTIPSAVAWHAGGATAGDRSRFQLFHRARGSVMFAWKHSRGAQRGACLAFRLGSFMAASARLLAAGRAHSIEAVWSGAWDGWRNR